MQSLLPTKDELPFLRAKAQVVGFCGGRGCGKSTALLLDGFLWRYLGVAHSMLIASRRAKTLLEEAWTLCHYRPLSNIPDVLRESSKDRLSWPASESWMLFDALREREWLLGREFDFIGIDDLEQFGANDLFFLLRRLRGGPEETKLRVTFSEAESWVQQFFAPWFQCRDKTTTDQRVRPAAYGEIRSFVRQGAAIRWLEPGEEAEWAISATVIR